MQLKHMNLCVSDVLATRDFFVNHFDFTAVSEQRSDAFSILADESGFSLVIMKAKPEVQVVYPGSFHIGFIVQHVDDVSLQRDRLVEADYTPTDIMHVRRATMFYCNGPDDLLIEVCAND